MQYKILGRSGLKVSQLSLGRWMAHGYDPDVNGVKSLLQCCHDHGVNFFDFAAEIYPDGRSEVLMGQAVRELGWKRSDFVISTKIYSFPKRKPTKIYYDGPGPNGMRLSRKHIVEETKASLKRLDMEYVDVIYCHRPDGPVEETVRAMNHVIDKGWALYWGTTEWSAKQIMEAWRFANRLNLVGPVVEQTKYNLLSRHKVEVKHMPLYSTYGIGLTTLSPLLSGALSEKYTKYDISLDDRFMSDVYMYLDTRLYCDDTLIKAKGLKLIADELDVTLPQLAIAWCALNPNVSSVISTMTTESQIIENMKAIDVIPKLTPEVIEKIEAVVQGACP